jgi:ubiquinone/menaquinone biosynthesis C-methylase UbiE
MESDRSRGPEDYVFDRTRTDEERRLERQSTLIDQSTERLFRDAGLTAGMRVLELGSGAGDVALLAGGIVGPTGAVVGVEGSPAAIATAEGRVEDAGQAHVSFLRGDLRALDTLIRPEDRFDALIGRLVLQFMPDPAEVLRVAASRVRPGGIVCFQECDHHYPYAYPRTELWDQVRTWFQAALDHAGVEKHMGLRLFQVFGSAGLPAPELRLEATIGGGERAPAFMWADLVRSVIPTLERAGIATEAEIQPETLVERLQADTTATGGVVITMVMVGAWSSVLSP